MNLARICSCITQVVTAPVHLAYQIMRAFKQEAQQPACVINLGDEKSAFFCSGSDITAMSAVVKINDKETRQIALNELAQRYINRVVGYLNSYTLSYDSSDGEDDVDGKEYSCLDNIHNLNRYRRFRLIVVTDGAKLNTPRAFSWRLVAAPLLVKLLPLVAEAYRGEVTKVTTLKMNGSEVSYRPDFVIDGAVTKNARTIARYTSGAYDGIRWMERHYPAFQPTGADMAEMLAATCHIDGDDDHAWDDIDQSYDEIVEAEDKPKQVSLRHTARMYEAPGINLIPCGKTRGVSSPFFKAEDRLNALMSYKTDSESKDLRQNRFAAELASFFDW